MNSLESFRRSRVKVVEHKIIDVNLPVPLASLTAEDKPRIMKQEVSLALSLAIREFQKAGIPLGSLVGFYLEDQDKVITHLEVRDLPQEIALHISQVFSDAGLGGSYSLTLDGKSANLGLPHFVNAYRLAPVIEVEALAPEIGEIPHERLPGEIS